MKILSVIGVSVLGVGHNICGDDLLGRGLSSVLF